jgi:hypothetical protein
LGVVAEEAAAVVVAVAVAATAVDPRCSSGKSSEPTDCGF